MKTAEERIAEALEYIRESRVEGGYLGIIRDILQPPPARHTFGGVTFEVAEGGVERPVEGEEWILNEWGNPVWWAGKSKARYTILKVVS